MDKKVADVIRNNIDLIGKRDFITLYSKCENKYEISQIVGALQQLHENPYPFIKTLGDIVKYDYLIIEKECFRVAEPCVISTKDDEDTEIFIKDLIGLIDFYVTQTSGFHFQWFTGWTPEMIDEINKSARRDGYSSVFTYVSNDEITVNIEGAKLCPAGSHEAGIYIDQALCEPTPLKMWSVKVNPLLKF